MATRYGNFGKAGFDEENGVRYFELTVLKSRRGIVAVTQVSLLTIIAGQ